MTYRLRKNTEAKRRSENMVSQAYDSLFTLAEPPPDAPKKRKKKRKKIKTAVSSDESERPLALTLKKRATPRPAKKEESKGKSSVGSDRYEANDDMDLNTSSHDISRDNDPRSPKDSVNAKQTTS